MSVFLCVREKGIARDVAVLEHGKPLRIGRSEDNDVSFPDDLQMSSRHAVIILKKDKCILKDLGSTNGTWVGDSHIETTQISDATVFRCGRTAFEIDWSNSQDVKPRVKSLSQRSVAEAASAAKKPPRPRAQTTVEMRHSGLEVKFDLEKSNGYCEPTALGIVLRFQLKQQIGITPEFGEEPEVFLERIRSLRDGNDAICFLAFALPRRCGVLWLSECLKGDFPLDEQEQELLTLALKWVRQPTEENRNAPIDYATANSVDGLTRWVAEAVFYCHGSTTPPDCPVVPPEDSLAGKTILAGISLAIVSSKDGINERRQAYIDKGLLIADQKPLD